MGLANAVLSFIAREHAAQAFSDPVLTLGRQDIPATRVEAYSILQRAGVIPPTLSPDEMRLDSSLGDVEFFRWLGLRHIQALDYSDYEHAEIIADLNQPIPEALRGKFGLIVDGGTLEHVFDVRQGLVNVADMLKPGGRVIHISPANNWTNHGFFQYSPTLYFDYYSANGFVNLRGYVAEQPLFGFEYSTWECFQGPFKTPRFISSQGLMNLFIAEKTINSTSHKIPIQTFYEQVYSQQSTSSARFRSLREKIPYHWQVRLARLFPWLNPFRKPWGGTRATKLG